MLWSLTIAMQWLLLQFISLVVCSFVFGKAGEVYSYVFSISSILICIVLAQTPFFEWLLSRSMSLSPVNTDSQLHDIFYNVCQKADVQYQLKLKNDDSPNAFAFGDKTVVLCTGILDCPNSQVEAVLAHEIAHIKLGHTKRQKASYAIAVWTQGILNFFVLLANVLRFIAIITSKIPFLSIVAIFFNWLISFYLFFAKYFISIPTNLVTLCNQRKQEFEADKWAAENGYSDGLISFLTTIEEGKAGLKQWFLQFKSTHPLAQKRIEQLLASREINVSMRLAAGNVGQR